MSESASKGQPVRRWLIVGCLFLIVLFNNGASFDTTMVFFPAILKETGWSHAWTAMLPSAASVTMALSMPLFGFLLDIFDAGALIAIGALLAGGAWLLASQSHGYWPLFVAFLIYGFGYTGTFAMPCAYVIANWFRSQRATALAITLSGSAVGATLATPVIYRVIAHSGYHHAYLLLCVPILVMIVPIAFIVRSRPGSRFGFRKRPSSSGAPSLPVEGLEVSSALHQWSFWAVALTNFLSYFGGTGTSVHLVACLNGLGLPGPKTAWIVSLGFALVGAGKLSMGWLADRITNRVALAGAMLVQGLSLVLLFTTASHFLIAGFALIKFFTVAVPVVLVQTLTADVVGLKRYGTLAGIIGICGFAGATAGPVTVGFLFDRTKTYSLPYALMALALAGGAMIALSARSRQTREVALAAAAGSKA